MLDLIYCMFVVGGSGEKMIAEFYFGSDLLQNLSMGQKIVHSWNEIEGWNTIYSEHIILDFKLKSFLDKRNEFIDNVNDNVWWARAPLWLLLVECEATN